MSNTAQTAEPVEAASGVQEVGPALSEAEGLPPLEAIQEHLRLADALRDFAAEFAHDNPDNRYAQEFAQHARRFKSTGADMLHAYRQALQLDVQEARDYAEQETRRNKKALRPGT